MPLSATLPLLKLSSALELILHGYNLARVDCLSRPISLTLLRPWFMKTPTPDRMPKHNRQMLLAILLVRVQL